jgi:hypothetical protein
MIKKSSNLLPTFFQTDKNAKFLSSTIDQFIQTPALERLDGFIGSKLSKNYNPSTDNYITYNQISRNRYQLEPGLIVRELDQSIAKAYGYDDLINQMNYHGADTDNLNKLFKPDFYSYDPQINWDKLINFREYYWLPTGPSPIKITGTQRELVSTFTVSDSEDGNFFIFTPDGISTDPQITLYRGVTYVFNIQSKNKFYIRQSPGYGPTDLYSTDVIGNGGQIVAKQVIISVSYTTPNILYYSADANQNAGGQFLIKTIDENSSINVEKEILGKAQYKSANGVEFVNGLKVNFGGDVKPEFYRDKDFIVEGVGDKITLIDFNSLDTPESIATQYDANFDAENFDNFPFDNFKNLPITPSYVTINRAGKDLNPWTRYNRWFHADVIKAVATANGQIVEYPVASRGQRPIIEFKPNLQLFNFGNVAVANVDVIDNTTTDVFSNVEKGFGYWVDGIQLESGFRVIFNADPDPLVKGRIYEVTFVSIDGDQRVNLVETADNIPVLNGCTTILKGETNGGTVWWYNGSQWIKGQQRTELNQAPLFDIVDGEGYSYGAYPYTSNFKGSKVFGYTVGSGLVDSVLGIPLKYKSNSIESSYLFSNYFSTDVIVRAFPNTGVTIPVSTGFLKLNENINNPQYLNVWKQSADYNIPVTQFQIAYDSVSSIEITTFDNPGYIDDIKIDVYVNDKKYKNTQYSVVQVDNQLYVNFVVPLSASTTGNRIKFEIYSDSLPNSSGVYATPINLTNNPLNGPVAELMLSELYDHLYTMVNRDPDFVGEFPGIGNIDRLYDIGKYGTRIISNKNPLSFSQYFISNKEHNLIEAIKIACEDYNQFKLNLIKTITELEDVVSPINGLDIALLTLNENKDISFPYFLSDMIPYGSNKTVRTYTVTDRRNLNYSISNVFDITAVSNTAILIYLNDTQLVYGKDYEFDLYDTTVNMKISLTKGDIITIQEYHNTDGCYIPSTPTKLGLYPKFEPKMYLDTSYANDPVNVIQGHDGSLLVAFNDYRDGIILEYETRIYNNLKTSYNADLFDINSVLPGVFRTGQYSYGQIYNLVQNNFLKWAGFYGIDYETHKFYDITNHKTYNYSSATDYIFNKNIPGSWRATYKYYFDTDRPDTHPWEMLGLTIKPDWWDSYYGSAPYTAGNLELWTDLRDGRIAQGPNAGINPLYARPQLFDIIPVDDSGNLIDIRNWAGLLQNDSIPETDKSWAFGEWGPVENVWRRSSNWPFVVQLIAALSKPADYSSKLFDTSRMSLNSAGQYTYSNNSFLIPSTVYLHGDVVDNVKVRAAGYSVYVIELGKKRKINYISTLKSHLQQGTFNLFAKLGGFVSKDKLSVIMDSVQPGTQNPTPYLPNEDYEVHFNVGNPIESIAISGIIVIKSNGKYIVRGYDKTNLYFTIFKPVHQISDKPVSIGAKSEDYVSWTSGNFYITGQIVFYDGTYYRTTFDHKATDTFQSKYFKALAGLPSAGGISVLKTFNFETQETIIPYGTEYSTLQELYDLLSGYSKWLESKGFVFDDFNQDFGEVLNWDFSAKELMYWSTQNWASNSVITLSPFANALEFVFQEGVVDNIFDSFYEYSLLKSDGLSFPQSSFNLYRNGNSFTIKTKNTYEGIFFARLNLVQKEHALVFNNSTIFNDVLYDVDTGYRQLRLKLKGFKTSEWNGDFFSPGFVYDQASTEFWTPYKDYLPGSIVEYVGKYYSAKKKVSGTEKFDFTDWFMLSNKPTANLLPNFEYKINQFEDFYSLDIDNFDSAQQKMAQHLIGYSPRSYLENIFDNPISQYKFYQGFIKEKGTKNALLKLEKASTANLQGTLELNEEWAFRLGYFGGYSNFNEIELPLREQDFIENNQSIQFVNSLPETPNHLISYITARDLSISPKDYISTETFKLSYSTYKDNNFILPHAGYVRVDDVEYVFTSTSALSSIQDNTIYRDGDKFWMGFESGDSWAVYRYTRQLRYAISAVSNVAGTITFKTNKPHGLKTSDIISIVNASPAIDTIYKIKSIDSLTEFVVDAVSTNVPAGAIIGIIFKFEPVRFSNVDEISNLKYIADIAPGELFWTDDNGTGKWTVFRKIDNYDALEYSAPRNKPKQQFGHQIAKQSNSSTVVISAGNFDDPLVSKGRIYVYESVGGSLKPITNYGLNSAAVDQYRQTTDKASFGDGIFYDETDDLIFATAPNASYIKPDTSGFVRQARSTNSVSTLTNVGLLKISGIFRSSIAYKVEIPYAVIVNPNPENRSKFGSGFHLQRNQFNKRLLVGAPNFYLSTSTGAVYRFDVGLSDISRSYLGVTGTNASGQLAEFNVTVKPDSRVYNVSVANSGTQYITDTLDYSFITIPGDRLGGLVPDNNLNIKISSAYQRREVTGIILLGGTISTITNVSNLQGLTLGTILVQRPGGSGSFGGQIARVIDVNYSNLDNLKITIEASTGTNTAGSIVFRYGGSIESIDLAATTGTAATRAFSITAPIQKTLTIPSLVSPGEEFGYRLTGDKDSQIIAVSSPGYNRGIGAVYIYQYSEDDSSYHYKQAITGTDPEYNKVIKTGDRLGTAITINETGEYLFIATSTASEGSIRPGKVSIYKWDSLSTKFVFSQILNNPSKESLLNFGHAISVNPDASVLAVTSQGANLFNGITFDDDVTTFDAGSSRFGDIIRNSGTAYVYNRYNKKFLLAQELFDTSINEGSFYGDSVIVDDRAVYVGNPNNTSVVDQNGSVYIWNEVDNTTNSWQEYRVQDDLVDINLIQKASTIDTLKEQVVDYLDILDPIKGRIPGLADQEVRYKTPFDPAVYSFGVDSVTVDTDGYWADEHIGELWWDLSSVKYLWYEQGDPTYRKAMWGQTFPGSSIDIYEWVKTIYPPSQWSRFADTNEGLSLNISGQPKFTDDSIFSARQTFNTNTNQFITYYYYWVKNKTIVPKHVDRRISAYEVSNIINDPKSYGLKYLSILGADSISLTNFKSNLLNERIFLNIAYNGIDSDVTKHTEWALVQENNQYSNPPALLEKKLIDSLLGKDSLGNLVPDPTLSARTRYGIEIRPKQSMFVDRFAALRNLIDYTNTILEQNLTRGYISFVNLNSKENIPDILLGEYDEIYEDIEGRDTVITNNVVRAKLSCSVTNGKITSVMIDNPGFGYKQAPTVLLVNIDSEAKIKTIIDSAGKIVETIIINPGSNFVQPPKLLVRAYTVIVQVDPDFNNKWSKYEWDNAWIRIHTQKFDTTKYWTYIDWIDSSFNTYKILTATVDELYQLATLTLAVGDYVKVKNPGDGKYIILRKSLTNGTFDTDFDIVYSEQGTIQILDSVWNVVSAQLGFDDVTAFDQLVFDESSEIELQNILTAIKEDIFVGSLKPYWNKFFFKAVKYALTEQRFVDWAFKTSFINVKNKAGVLDQRPTYRYQDPTWYEDYLKEIKPYHTNIRNYQVNYQVGESQSAPWEMTETYTTDFDLPAIYDQPSKSFITVGPNDDILNQYPYKAWNDNHTYGVESISVSYGGKGYRTVPRVDIITAEGDEGYGATAIAYISIGKITSIEVLDTGKNYKKTPIVVITGGGDSSLSVAIASANLANNKVRSNFIGLKFDRITANSSTFIVSSQRTTATFLTSGVDFKYTLPWYASLDNTSTTVTLGDDPINDGIIIVKSNYVINNSTAYSSTFGYHKQTSTLVLENIPPRGKYLKVSYNKNINLYSAAERIRDYYNPDSGMPGVQLEQLMDGVAFPGVNVRGLPFSADAGWDNTEFESNTWDTFDPDIFHSSVTTATNTQTFIVPEISSGTVINVYVEQFNIDGIRTSFKRIDSTGTSSLVQSIVGTGTAVSVVVPQIAFTATSAFSKVVFRSLESNAPLIPQEIDTVYDGGTLPLYSSKAGLSPTSIILDGEAFVSPYTNYGPEEIVPGQVEESVSISVFTREEKGSPLISVQSHLIQSTSTSTSIDLRIQPANTASVMVSFAGKGLVYGRDYTVNFVNKTVTINQTTSTGIAGITVVTVGGDKLLGSKLVTTNSTSTTIEGIPKFDDISSIYVTCNGETLKEITGNSLGYTLKPKSTKNRSSVLTVHNMSTGTNIIQAWFFQSKNKGYSEVKEQIITINTSTSVIDLLQPPGTLGPFHAQVIVEHNGKRLTPPDTTYYQISNDGQTIFGISPDEPVAPGLYDLSQLEIHINGIKQESGVHFNLSQIDNNIIFNEGYLLEGDVLAITTLLNSDYIIKDDQVILSNSVSSGTLKIITYTTQDASSIRTEVFRTSNVNLFRMSRPILNDNYVWVSVNGEPLISRVDYSILEDRQTVKVNDNFTVGKENNKIVITSFTDINANRAIGYRIFKDLFGATYYKRYSDKNTTFLTQPFLITDTEIYVDNSAVLSIPSIKNNAPGVIFIGTERIEYFTVNNNVLGQLRRGTYGTGVKETYVIGTAVIDASRTQTVPYKEVISSTSTKTVDSIQTVFDLTNLPLNSNVRYEDQLEIYYAGRLLNKSSSTIHNAELGYDSYENNSDIIVPPEFSIVTSSTALIPRVIEQSKVVLLYVSTATETADNYQTIILTNGTNWTVPADFTSDNSIEIWGGGAGGSATPYSGGGGGGGGYAYISNIDLTTGTTIDYVIGEAGTGGEWVNVNVININPIYHYSPATNGGTTWFGSYNTSTSYIFATGGIAASGEFGGRGGSSGIGSSGTEYISNIMLASGGRGGSLGVGTGGGGGAAGGYYGNGDDGEDGQDPLDLNHPELHTINNGGGGGGGGTSYTTGIGKGYSQGTNIAGIGGTVGFDLTTQVSAPGPQGFGGGGAGTYKSLVGQVNGYAGTGTSGAIVIRYKSSNPLALSTAIIPVITTITTTATVLAPVIISYNNPVLLLNFIPQPNVTINMVSRGGKVWYTQGANEASNGVSLLESTTPQAIFLLERQSGLLDKYQYGQL